MSRFNDYAKRADAAAKAAFKEYREAERAYREAEKKVNSIPKGTNGVLPKYQADHARAQADFYEKRDAYKAAHNKFINSENVLAGIRRELAAEINEAYAADPAAMDSNTIELLKSGVLNADEYVRMFEKAENEGNHTMARMIGKYADDAAAAITDRNGRNDPNALLLRRVAHAGKANDGREYLEAFDSIANVYHRCTRNGALIDSWDDLVGEVVSDF